MNTYNIQVNGIEVIAQVTQEELQKNLNTEKSKSDVLQKQIIDFQKQIVYLILLR